LKKRIASMVPGWEEEKDVPTSTADESSVAAGTVGTAEPIRVCRAGASTWRVPKLHTWLGRAAPELEVMPLSVAVTLAPGGSDAAGVNVTVRPSADRLVVPLSALVPALTLRA
jgi:hypothetical protein